MCYYSEHGESCVTERPDCCILRFELVSRSWAEVQWTLPRWASSQLRGGGCERFTATTPVCVGGAPCSCHASQLRGTASGHIREVHRSAVGDLSQLRNLGDGASTRGPRQNRFHGTGIEVFWSMLNEPIPIHSTRSARGSWIATSGIRRETQPANRLPSGARTYEAHSFRLA